MHIRAELVAAKLARIQGNADEALSAANKALAMAQGMDKNRDAVLTAEIKDFLKPQGFSFVIPASFVAVVSVIAVSGTMLLL